MKDVFKKYEHNPPHLFVSNAKFFITASTYEKHPYFKTDESKEALQKYLFKSYRHN